MADKLAGVLLDIDGTLIDSNDANARAWMEALFAHGIEVNYLKLREGVGMGGDNFLPKIAHIESDSPQGKAISETRSRILKSQYLPTLHAFPQVKELLTRLHGDGLKLVVATSAKPDEADALLKLTGAADLIDAIATTEDAENSKPAPDIIQAALKKSGLAAGEVVMLGDTPYDVESAQKAHVGIVGVRCGGWTAPDLKGALAVYNDPADLLAHYDESPLIRAD
jgi:HAD superfamily hydrolase (TIGR01509 family)